MVTTTSVARRIQANRRLVRDSATADDVDRAKSRLDAVFSAYPGIVAARSRVSVETTCSPNRPVPGHGRLQPSGHSSR